MPHSVVRSAPQLAPSLAPGRRLAARLPVVAIPVQPGPAPHAQPLGDRYRPVEPVSAVDGGTVWRGTDEVLHREVAIWELRADRPVPIAVIAAVLGAARLTDRRIARVFDADCAARRPYIITEWARGDSVERLLRNGPPDPLTAVSVTLDAVAALAAAHEAGWAHLRLTPASVRCGESGLKVTGIGIEAALAGAVAADPAAADARALAGLLYALLTGYWPGGDPSRLPRAPRYRGQLCVPGDVRAGVPDVLDELIRRALLPGHAQPVRSPAQFGRELCRSRWLLRPLGGRRTGRPGLNRPEARSRHRQA